MLVRAPNPNATGSLLVVRAGDCELGAFALEESHKLVGVSD